MIPRLKPYLGREELLAALRPRRGAVARFEMEFARAFEASWAVAFPYGRSGLWAFIKALGIQGAEVILPAYTCSVVAHAIVLSGNIPRFVDIRLDDYNMDLDEVEVAINEQTAAVIATHLFGYPLDVYRLGAIVQRAEARWGHKLWVVQDCAHAFGAHWQGRLVCAEGDVALFGLNISKTITSVFGGMVTGNDAALETRLREFRDQTFRRPGRRKHLRRLLYLLGVYAAFGESSYGPVHWLEEHTSLLDPLTKAYHRDEAIHFPPDFEEHMNDLEAEVGLVQLRKYGEIVRQRKGNARFYDLYLRGVQGVRLPPLEEGATFSHYAVLVEDRAPWRATLRRAGVELGEVIEYSIPELPAYSKHRTREFPNSQKAMMGILNLPVYAGLDESRLRRVVSAVIACARQLHTEGMGSVRTQPHEENVSSRF